MPLWQINIDVEKHQKCRSFSERVTMRVPQQNVSLPAGGILLDKQT